jgi:hypothetical protein
VSHSFVRREVFVAFGSCGVQGNHVKRLNRGDPPPPVLLETIAYDVVPFGAATPLPQVRESANDSALSRDETIDTYRDGRYVATSAARVRNSDSARKPLQIPVRFPAGASSAVLHGTASVAAMPTRLPQAAARTCPSRMCAQACR